VIAIFAPNNPLTLECCPRRAQSGVRRSSDMREWSNLSLD